MPQPFLIPAAEGLRGPCVTQAQAALAHVTDGRRLRRITKMWRAAELRVLGLTWLEISATLDMPLKTLEKFPAADLWRTLYDAAEENRMAEAAATAIKTQLDLMKNAPPAVRQAAAHSILHARSRQWVRKQQINANVNEQHGPALAPEIKDLIDFLTTISPEEAKRIIDDAQPIDVECRPATPS